MAETPSSHDAGGLTLASVERVVNRTATPPSRSVARVLDMLDVFLTTTDGLTLTEIAHRCGVPKSTAHGILQTMRARAYLSWDPETKAYSVGLRLISLARAAPILQMLQRHARAHLERLVADLHESALLLVYEGQRIVCVDKVDSPRPIRYSATIGERWPLYCTSAGKLYLARLSDDEVHTMLASELLTEFTVGTPTNIDQIMEDVRRARRDGMSVNREEIVAGVTGCGAPVHGPGDQVIAALSVVGPTGRIESNIDAIVADVVNEARRLSAELSGDADESA